MKALGKSQQYTETLVPKSGQRKRLLPSSKVGTRCPALGFDTIPAEVSDDILIKELAKILVEGYIELQKNECQQQASSHILPGIDKRTS